MRIALKSTCGDSTPQKEQAAGRGNLSAKGAVLPQPVNGITGQMWDGFSWPAFLFGLIGPVREDQERHPRRAGEDDGRRGQPESSCVSWLGAYAGDAAASSA